MDPICGCPPGQNPFSRGGFGRRQALRATGIGFVATLTGILTGAGQVARAQRECPEIGGQAASAQCGPDLGAGLNRWPRPEPSAPL